jgi:molybdenum cofactor synthesis domain-containing protein
MFEAVVITVSDRSYRGEREDTGGPLTVRLLKTAGFGVADTAVVPDEQGQIEEKLIYFADERKIPLIVTTGGTGFAPRDVTPEATIAVCERLAPGIPEAMRAASMKITDRAMLSRMAAGIRGGSLIINLPGSPKALRENLEAILPALTHGLEMLTGGQADCAATGRGQTDCAATSRGHL